MSTDNSQEKLIMCWRNATTNSTRPKQNSVKNVTWRRKYKTLRTVLDCKNFMKLDKLKRLSLLD